jgi:hypothetical protein
MAARSLGWTAGPDRFAYAAVVGVGATREEGLRRANLAADYVRTSPVVAEAFTNPPGYNSLSANRLLKEPINRRLDRMQVLAIVCRKWCQSPQW